MIFSIFFKLIFEDDLKGIANWKINNFLDHKKYGKRARSWSLILVIKILNISIFFNSLLLLLLQDYLQAFRRKLWSLIEIF